MPQGASLRRDLGPAPHGSGLPLQTVPAASSSAHSASLKTRERV